MEKPRMSLRPLLLVLAAACLLSRAPAVGTTLEPAAAAPAPSERISFHGRVLDPAGMPISGARVTAETEGRATVPAGPVTAVTDAEGQFILELATGRYALRVAVDGFAETVQHVSLTPDERPTGRYAAFPATTPRFADRTGPGFGSRCPTARRPTSGVRDRR